MINSLTKEGRIIMAFQRDSEKIKEVLKSEKHGSFVLPEGKKKINKVQAIYLVDEDTKDAIAEIAKVQNFSSVSKFVDAVFKQIVEENQSKLSSRR